MKSNSGIQRRDSRSGIPSSPQNLGSNFFQPQNVDRFFAGIPNRIQNWSFGSSHPKLKQRAVPPKFPTVYSLAVTFHDEPVEDPHPAGWTKLLSDVLPTNADELPDVGLQPGRPMAKALHRFTQLRDIRVWPRLYAPSAQAIQCRSNPSEDYPSNRISGFQALRQPTNSKAR